MKLLSWNVNGLRSALRKDFAKQMWDVDGANKAKATICKKRTTRATC